MSDTTSNRPDGESRGAHEAFDPSDLEDTIIGAAVPDDGGDDAAADDGGADAAADDTASSSALGGTAAAVGAHRARTGDGPAHGTPAAGRTSAVARTSSAARGPARTGGGRPAPARLEVRRVSVLSVLRISAAVSVIWFLVWMIALALLYAGLQAMGVFASISELIGGVDQLTFGTVLGGGALLGLLWAIIGVLLSVIGAAIFNACAGLAGGVEVDVVRG